MHADLTMEQAQVHFDVFMAEEQLVPRSVSAFRQAAAHGLNLARTWAFSDGGDRPLQSSPSVYQEDMFQVS